MSGALCDRSPLASSSDLVSRETIFCTDFSMTCLVCEEKHLFERHLYFMQPLLGPRMGQKRLFTQRPPREVKMDADRCILQQAKDVPAKLL